MLAFLQLMRDIMETIEIKDFVELPYGENVTQTASVSPVENGLDYEILSETPSLEYLDYLNLSKVVEVLAEFFDVNSAAISKEGLLCSVALGSSCENVFEKIVESDPLCISNSTIGFSKNVTLDVAKQITAMNFRNVISPSFDKAAVDFLTNDSNVNVIKIKSPLQELLGFNACDIKVTPFGYLVQSQNFSKLTKSSFKVAGKTKPTQQQAEDAIFAWKVAKYAKSKSAVIAKDLAVKAIVQSRHHSIESVERAMDLACENSKDAVLAVDGVVENEEIINTAIQGRIGLIIESGDLSNSSKFSKLADKYNIAYIVTGIRNNKY
jgi:phosphoribosylaminoimidazolecarboxamide formyltransferase/IMP cyclohydrolase